MNRSTEQTTADYYSYLCDNFQDAAQAFFNHSLAKHLAPWADVWKSEAVRIHLLVIAMELAKEFPTQEKMDDEGNYIEPKDLTDQVNDFVDCQLQAMPWVSIAAEAM
jgi:hypothetical protein